jgi:2-dehydropantoate 2-reductase
VSFDAEGAEARSKGVTPTALGKVERPGGSSWQSLSRRTGNIETDYLNGEIVLLGRMTKTPTPANALLQQLSNELASQRKEPGAMSETGFLERLTAAG